MLRRVGIRGKILAALVLPVLVLFVLAGAVSWQSIETVQTARAVQDVLRAVEGSRELTTALQDERAAAVAAYRDTATAEDQATLEELQGDTDRALARYRGHIAGVDMDGLDELAVIARDRLGNNLGILDSARAMLDVRTVQPITVYNTYTNIITSTVRFPSDMASAMTDRQLGTILGTQAQLLDLVENYRQEQVLGREVLVGAASSEMEENLLDLLDATDEMHFDVSGEVQTLGVEGLSLSTGLGRALGFESYDSMRDLIANPSGAFRADLEPDVWVERAADEIDIVDTLQTDIALLANERAETVTADAIRTSGFTVGIALSAVTISIAVALAIAHRIAHRITRLTEAANEVRDELPRLVDQVAVPGQRPDLDLARIKVDSGDELGQLAGAFNEVNSTTIEVAQEQAALRESIAEMFVNVARRDQVLLNRQLSFIDALERSEEDPKTLADLFRLDHLATRMRRNAESLLVLAGIDTGRRLRDALPTSDVIRTASSEIEHYERIQIDLPVDPTMLGHTALPAAHLLAELLENATVFSDPGTPVHVSTGVDDTHVVVTVQDQGLGMTDEELAEANTKISTTGASEVLGAQRLGLFVVGRIAQRLGAVVRLERAQEGGTLATVRFPLVLFVDAATLPRVAPTAPAERHESLVPLEAAAEAYATGHTPEPVLGDVAPGSVGSAENPAVEIDLSALTDGTTTHGLPRRRAVSPSEAAPPSAAIRSDEQRVADDAAASSALPVAPAPEAFAGVLADDEVWSPPVVEPAAPLSVRRPARPDDAPEPAPTAFVEPPAETGSTALPVRRPTGVTAPEPAAAPAVPSGPAADEQPASVEQRSAMFTGFRSRRAELAAASVHVEGTSPEASTSDEAPVDGAERLAAAAAFFGRSATERPAGEQSGSTDEAADEAPAPMVIPALVDDDDDDFGDPVFAPGAPAAVVEPALPSRVTPSEEAPYLGRHALPPVDEPVPSDDWQPVAARGAHVLEPEPQAWVDDAPAYDATTYEAQDAPAYDTYTDDAPTHDAPAFADVVDEVPWPPAADVTADAGAGTEDAEPEPWAAPAWSPVAESDAAAPTPEADVAWPPAPVEPTPVAAEEPAPFAEAPQVAPSAGAAPQPEAEEKPRKKRRWFGRRKDDDVAALPEPAPSVPETVAPAWRPDPVVADAAVAEPAPEAPFQPVPGAPAAFSPGFDVPAPRRPASADAPADTQPAWQPPQVDIPAAAVQPEESWAPSSGWSEEPAGAPAEGLPARASSVTPRTTFTPEPSGGTFDDEITNMLAQKADIAQQALAELSQLSSYRPKTDGSGATPLVRRTPGTIPAAPAIEKRTPTERTERDADQVRSLLSSFQSGTTRGRLAGGTDGAVQDPGAAPAPAGHDVGGESHGEPVHAPDTDLTRRSTSW